MKELEGGGIIVMVSSFKAYLCESHDSLGVLLFWLSLSLFVSSGIEC
jgi:hypothetical protein